jgi:hypothetical protein
MQNTLAYCYPNIAKEWHRTRNGSLTPDDVSKRSGKKVWWMCPKTCKCCNCLHEYQATIDSRTPKPSGNLGSGCPFCAGKKICCRLHSIWRYFNENTCRYWNLEKNVNIFPTKLSKSSHTKVWLEHPYCNHVHKKEGNPAIIYRPPYVDLSLHIKKRQSNNLIEALDLSIQHKIYDWNSYNDVICRHEWYERPTKLLTGDTKCVYCCEPRKKICKDTSIAATFPNIMKEWHPEKNKGFDPYNISPNSHKEIWWLCANKTCNHGCKHEWTAPPSNRTRVNSGCPFCSKPVKTVCKHKSIGYLFPDLCTQLHPVKNKDIDIYKISASSKINATWICPVIGCDYGCIYEWDTTFYQRTIINNSMFYCGTAYQCEHKYLSFQNPELFKQIHDSLNNDIDIESLSIGSNKKIWWQCPVDKDHIWCTSVNHRYKGTDCPVCCQRNKSSKMEIEWVKYLSLSHPNIMSVLSENGQFIIPSTRFQCDGYCPDCNTIFEFHGDFWHGNPKIYNSTDINRVTKTTFGELHLKTLQKKDMCVSMGYNYICIWEDTWMNVVDAVKILQKKIRSFGKINFDAS